MTKTYNLTLSEQDFEAVGYALICAERAYTERIRTASDRLSKRPAGDSPQVETDLLLIESLPAKRNHIRALRWQIDRCPVVIGSEG